MTCYLATYIKIIARQVLGNNVVITYLKKLVNDAMAVLFAMYIFCYVVIPFNQPSGRGL